MQQPKHVNTLTPYRPCLQAAGVTLGPIRSITDNNFAPTPSPVPMPGEQVGRLLGRVRVSLVRACVCFMAAGPLSLGPDGRELNAPAWHCVACLPAMR